MNKSLWEPQTAQMTSYEIRMWSIKACNNLKVSKEPFQSIMFMLGLKKTPECSTDTKIQKLFFRKTFSALLEKMGSHIDKSHGLLSDQMR